MDKGQEAVYFASAIDHDGFISIQRSKKKKYHHPTFCVKVGYTQSRNDAVAKMLKENYGGGVYEYNYEYSKHTLYQWHCESRKAERFLRDVLPFLIIKREQACIALEFLQLKTVQYKEIKNTQIPPYKLTEAMTEGRQNLWAEIVLLNGSNRLRKRNREIAEKIIQRVGKKRAGHLLDGRTWQEFPAQQEAKRRDDARG